MSSLDKYYCITSTIYTKIIRIHMMRNLNLPGLQLITDKNSLSMVGSIGRSSLVCQAPSRSTYGGPRISVVSRPGIPDSGEGVVASCGSGVGLVTEIRAQKSLSIPSPKISSNSLRTTTGATRKAPVPMKQPSVHRM